MNKMLKSLVSTIILLAVTPMWPADKEKDEDRLNKSRTVLKEILDIPDDVPRKADCAVVFPSVVKAAFIVGGSYGRGAMTCRTGKDFEGPWGAPSKLALEGGSIGLQLGGEATDFVLQVTNDRGANAILASKVKLGGDACVAARPVGREMTAETDVSLRAEIDGQRPGSHCG